MSDRSIHSLHLGLRHQVISSDLLKQAQFSARSKKEEAQIVYYEKNWTGTKMQFISQFVKHKNVCI